MHELRNRTAVITGAASGIGLALAQRAAREGMRLVLADIDEAKLAEAAKTLPVAADALCTRRVDVSREEDVAALADEAFGRYGGVHLLCNNAGVGLTRLAWELTAADWEWILGVNLWSVVHAVHCFVPRMLAGGDEGHVVNTASVAGLISGPGPYFASKHGVVCLSEALYKELRAAGARLSASVLCPGLVRTAILDAERNRPAAFGPRTDLQSASASVREAAASFRESLQSGYAPSQVADAVLDGVRADRFYIVPAQPPLVDLVRLRLQDILEGRNPTLPPSR